MSTGANDLTTLADLKAWLEGTPTDNSFDTQFQALITAASLFMAKYCNRTFIIQGFTEYRDGNSRCKMLLKNYPVQEVTSVTVNGVSIPAAPDTISPGFVVPDSNDNRGLLMLRGYEFCKGYQNVVVQYEAGIFSNSAGASGTDVGWACRELCNQKWKKRPRPDTVANTLGGQITASFSQKDMPPEVQTLLNQYMNPAIPFG